MELFWQGAALVLLGVVLSLALGKHGGEAGILLTVAVCCTVAVLALNYLKPVVEFIRQLEQIGRLDDEMLQILLKAAGIGIITEIAAMICADAGKGAMGKALQMLGTAAILWLSLPLLTQLLELLQQILGEV